MFRQLTNGEIETRWAEIAPRLQAAVDYGHGDFTIDDIYRDIMAKEAQVWVLENMTGALHSLCLTQIINYDRQRACAIVLAEGSIDSRWAPAIDTIGRWAKANGCIRLEARARHGWLKKIDAFGFKHLETTIYKLL